MVKVCLLSLLLLDYNIAFLGKRVGRWAGMRNLCEKRQVFRKERTAGMVVRVLARGRKELHPHPPPIRLCPA